MTTQGRRSLAASRAQYFSDLNREDERTGETPRRPSYVGVSHSLNGYTPYAPYTNSNSRKISPPHHLPATPPQGLSSVSLVLNEDSFQRSLNDFNLTMRDLCSLDMGRQRNNSDMTDNASPTIISGQDGFYPKSQVKKVTANGDRTSTEILTVFHSGKESSTPTPATRNLVTKQIERLYGDSFAQLRLTPSPDSSTSSLNNGCSSPPPEENGITPPERKLSGSGGGFFAKRFGITKMKDHSTLRNTPTGTPTTTGEPRPLKVPAVFRLLRPEFREQLKTSSCQVSMPAENGGVERIIPIHREAHSTSRSPNSSVSASPQSACPERIIPIVRETTTTTTPPKTATNGTVKRQQVPTVIGFKQSYFSPICSSSNGNGYSDRINGGKPIVVRKLSPLSPKHIVVPVCGGGGSGVKPAPPIKPDHLKSPPMSPVPSEEPNSNRSSPLHYNNNQHPMRSASVSNSSLSAVAVTASEETFPVMTDTAAMTEVTLPEDSSDSESLPAVSAEDPVPQTSSTHVEERADDLSTEDVLAESAEIPPDSSETASVVTASSGPSSLTEQGDQLIVAVQHQNGSAFVELLPDEQERTEFGYEDELDEDEEGGGYHHQVHHYGLRERELLCPILEEDNESSASGSLPNLAARSAVTTTATAYLPDDPLLFTEQGELQDGHYFIKVLENEIFKFEEQICDFEEELSNESLPEEARDNVLATVGQAKLLMAQKLAQFRGLCDKNIHVTKEEDPFVPTCQDLAGFWDMVHIQVEQVHGKFAKLQELRAAGWIIQVPVPEAKVAKTSSRKANAKVNKPVLRAGGKSEAAKARDEARKKMMEERKRAMKANQLNSDSGLIMIM